MPRVAVDALAAAFAPREKRVAWPDPSWQQNPVGYCRDVLGTEPWAKQIEIMESVRDHPRVAVASGHKIGKSRIAACVALWFFCSFPGARVILTSASSRQVRSILWREIRLLCRQAKRSVNATPPLKLPDPGLEADDSREVKGFTTDDPERMAGISGENVLFIVDEASGVPAEIFHAIEGNRAGGARTLLLSNPTQTTGEFFDAFHGKRAFYRTIQVSSEETPNVREGRSVIPGLATRVWVEEKRKEWGPEYLLNPLYQVRVLGRFPTQAQNAVVSLHDVTEARRRWAETVEEWRIAVESGLSAPDPTRLGPLEIGLDVARFGDDDSIILPRRGRRALEVVRVTGMDTVFVAGKALETARRLRRPGETVKIKVDTIGVGGGVADLLRASDDAARGEIDVIDVNSSSASASPEKYANLRAELHFGLAAWLKTGEIPESPNLEVELLAPRYMFAPKGQQKIESKDDIKKRLGRSPDEADALALAVYEAGGGYTAASAEQEVHTFDPDMVPMGFG